MSNTHVTIVIDALQMPQEAIGLHIYKPLRFLTGHKRIIEKISAITEGELQ